MAYKKSDMVYGDYKWSARADHDNPKVVGKPDSTELNRTEGYEMLYFINRLSHLWNWNENAIASMKRLEEVIRTKVPSNIRTHKGIREWVQQNYSKL